MAALADAWIALGRLTRRRGKGARPDRWDMRWKWIEENVAGRSFADIGGLFGVAGDVALAAEAAGASRVSLFDAGDAPLTDFPRKAAQRGSSVRVVQGDLADPVAVRRVGKHDIVWCTGVLYHTPNPLEQLMHLREITRELLYLGTHTIPEVPGLPQACLFYPYLSDEMRATIRRAHWDASDALGIGQPFDDHPMRGYGNFWWGITPSALRAMLRTARFEVVEELRTREYPIHSELVARPLDEPPLMPPVPYYRERAERRERGDPEPEFLTFYEETGRGYL